MSEQTINPDPSAPPQIGSRLAAAREARALSIDQVARKLLVSASQIRAIESGRMPSSYSSTYYEQIVQKYASFLGAELDSSILPSAAASVAQAQGTNQDASPAGRLAGFSPQRVGIGGRVDMPTLGSGHGATKWMIAALVVLVAAGGFLWKALFQGETAQTPDGSGREPVAAAAGAAAPAIASTPSPVAPVAAPATAGTPATVPVAAGSATGPATTTDQEKSKQPVPGPGATPSGQGPAATAAANSDARRNDADGNESRIVVTFTAPCWVQSISSDGTKTEKIYQPDQELVLAGDRLAALTIGNARAARMTLNGTEVSLTQFMKGSSDVARISDVGLQSLLR